MYPRILPSVLAFVAAAAPLVACTKTTVVTPPPEDKADAASEEPQVAEIVDAGTAPPACVLPDDVTSGRKSCDDCLQQKCCAVIETCFKDDKCWAMNLCADECAGDSACISECVAQDSKAAERLLDMKKCQNDRCKSPCTG